VSLKAHALLHELKAKQRGAPKRRPRNNSEGRTLDEASKYYMEFIMNGIIYLVGLVVVVMAVLSLIGLR
jgi:hypothetical protein